MIQTQTHSLESSSVYRKEFFKINGRYCNSCKTELEGVLDRLIGIKKVEINYITNILTLQYDPNIISNTNLVKILESQCKFIKIKDGIILAL
ncbi:MAG: heavy-metal-associated domain-containing protein [Candidatus Nitrosocosmicus sp.]